MSTERLDFLRGCLQIFSENSERILTFQKYLKTDFEKKLFEAAINNLLDIHNPLRFNNFSYAMRELIEHTLKRLAPDDHVKRCSWYVCPSGEIKVTRSQRIKYAIQKRLSDDFVSQRLGVDVFNEQKKIKKLIKNLNKYTHVTEDSFNVEPAEQLIKLSAFLNIFLNMFETMRIAENKVIDTVIEHVEEKIIREFFNIYSELEEFATHVRWGSYEIEDVELANIDHEKLQIRVFGVLEPQFQLGSDSDVKRGDGMLFTKPIPFICILTSSVENPYDLQIKEFKIEKEGYDNFWKGSRIVDI